jgi:hypothetical protein
VLTGFGYTEGDVKDFWNERKPSTQRSFMRELRYYYEGLSALGIDVRQLTTYSQVERTMLSVLRWLRREKQLSPSVCADTKNGVSVMYSYMSEWPRLTVSKPLCGLIKTFWMEAPPTKQQLKLNWHLVQLLRYLRTLPSVEYLEWDILMSVTICIVKIFGRVRYTEMEMLDAEQTEPNSTEWNFEVQLKGRKHKEIIAILRLRELVLDPVRHFAGGQTARKGKENRRRVHAGNHILDG